VGASAPTNYQKGKAMKITAKALAALTQLHEEGWRCQISRQMIDSLTAKKLIDWSFFGYYLTPAGQEILKKGQTA
jgi:hypothetical protein